MSLSKLILAASVFSLSGSAFAQEATEFVIGPSVLSRAQVLAELAQAQREGTIPFGEIGHVFKIGPSTLSRAQVVAETKEAMRLGLVPVGDLNPRVATAQELELIRLAGERAAQAVSQM